MGIFRQYGIEYSIKLKNGTFIPVVPVNSTDNRLLASKYYQTRKEFYERAYGPWREKVVECDCELSSLETDKLNNTIDLHGNNVVEHGWYDVCTVSTSY